MREEDDILVMEGKRPGLRRSLDLGIDFALKVLDPAEGLNDKENPCSD